MLRDGPHRQRRRAILGRARRRAGGAEGREHATRPTQARHDRAAPPARRLVGVLLPARARARRHQPGGARRPPAAAGRPQHAGGGARGRARRCSARDAAAARRAPPRGSRAPPRAGSSAGPRRCRPAGTSAAPPPPAAPARRYHRGGRFLAIPDLTGDERRQLRRSAFAQAEYVLSPGAARGGVRRGRLQRDRAPDFVPPAPHSPLSPAPVFGCFRPS